MSAAAEPRGLVVGKVALVTGAASGIGRASALAFAHEGARVVLCDLEADAGEETAESIRAAGGDAIFVRADVSDEAQVAGLVKRVVEAHGRLDCAYNNAGITGAVGALHEISIEGWERTLAVDLTGVFLCMKYEIAQMIAQGGGAIVNTSSKAAVSATAMLSPYTAAKCGVLGLTQVAALENLNTGVRVNAICPGSIDTPMMRGFMGRDPALERRVLAGQPGGRLGTPAQIAEAAVWLCSERASFVSGETLVVDGAAVLR